MTRGDWQEMKEGRRRRNNRRGRRVGRGREGSDATLRRRAERDDIAGRDEGGGRQRASDEARERGQGERADTDALVVEGGRGSASAEGTERRGGQCADADAQLLTKRWYGSDCAHSIPPVHGAIGWRHKWERRDSGGKVAGPNQRERGEEHAGGGQVGRGASGCDWRRELGVP